MTWCRVPKRAPRCARQRPKRVARRDRAAEVSRAGLVSEGRIVRNGHVARLAPALMVKDHESAQFQHKLTQGIHAPRMQLLPPAYCKALVGPLNVACGSRPCENADEPLFRAASCLVSHGRPGNPPGRDVRLYK